MNPFARKLSVAVATVALTAGSLAGCQTTQTGQGSSGPSNTGRGAAIGAAAGGAIGAVVGRNTGNTARGAIIGAVVGGAAGAVIGRQMDRQAQEIEQNVEGAEVQRVGEGIAVTFASGILYPYNSDQLVPAGRENLRALAGTLQRYPGSEVLIVGHTDSTGSDQYNMGLSLRRAESAANYLVAQGIARNRIRTSGRGEMEPIASNESEAGRQQNRRVEVAIFASEEYRQRILNDNRQ
jgi:outer membrane protein OmpA-like peptidoglycan-associated protein